MDVSDSAGLAAGETPGSTLQEKISKSIESQTLPDETASKPLEQAESGSSPEDTPVVKTASTAIYGSLQDPEAKSAEAAILARAQGGDHVAFAQLYSAHKRRV